MFRIFLILNVWFERIDILFLRAVKAKRKRNLRTLRWLLLWKPERASLQQLRFRSTLGVNYFDFVEDDTQVLLHASNLLY